jgi:hypothetical protein
MQAFCAFSKSCSLQPSIHRLANAALSKRIARIARAGSPVPHALEHGASWHNKHRAASSWMFNFRSMILKFRFSVISLFKSAKIQNSFQYSVISPQFFIRIDLIKNED